MAENLASDHWERYAQLLRGWRQTFKLELKRQQRHCNHSGGEGSRDECFPSLTPHPVEVPGLTVNVSSC